METLCWKKNQQMYVTLRYGMAKPDSTRSEAQVIYYI